MPLKRLQEQLRAALDVERYRALGVSVSIGAMQITHGAEHMETAEQAIQAVDALPYEEKKRARKGPYRRRCGPIRRRGVLTHARPWIHAGSAARGLRGAARYSVRPYSTLTVRC